MVKKIPFFLFFIFFIPLILFAKSHICIQIGAYPITQITSIYNDRKTAAFLGERSDCIMDKRKGGAFYGVCCGDFPSYKLAKKELFKIRKKFSKAFPRKFNPATAEEIAIISEVKRVNVSKNENNKSSSKKIKKVKRARKAKTLKKKVSKESRVVVKNVKPQIKKKQKNVPSSDERFDDFLARNIVNSRSNASYDIFSLKKYLTILKKVDLDYKNSEFASQLFKFNSLIERDKYNPYLYLSAETTSRKTYNVGTATNKATIDGLVAIHLDWHLYDAQKTYYNNERKVIFDRLSELNLLAANDKLMINGIYIYMNLWYLQRIIDDYNFLLVQQEKLVKMARVREMRGGNINFYEPIDTQNDYFNLELTIADIKENYAEQEYVFRQSIELMSPKPVYLYDPVYTDMNLSLKELQKQAVANNRELAKLQEKYKLSKSDIAIAAARKGISLDFFSYIGYGASTEIEGSNTDSGNGFEWQVGLRATYPLYSRNDINLDIKKKKVIAAQAALDVARKIKALTTSVNKLYNLIQKLRYKDNIYVAQNKILRERLRISYKRYMSGEDTYKEYSDTLRLYTENFRQRLLNESLLHASILHMYILTGKNLF